MPSASPARDLGAAEAGCWTGSPPAATARWIIWRATARKRARPAELVPGTLQRHQRAHELPARSAADAPTMLADGDARRILALCPGPRLPQAAARPPAEAGRPHRATKSATFGYRVFTDSAPVMEVELAQERRPGLARQAHAAADARGRLVVFSRRDLSPTCRCRRMRRSADHCGTCTRLPRRLPDAAPSSRPTGSMRGAASPTSPSSSRAAFRWNCAR